VTESWIWIDTITRIDEQKIILYYGLRVAAVRTSIVFMSIVLYELF